LARKEGKMRHTNFFLVQKDKEKNLRVVSNWLPKKEALEKARREALASNSTIYIMVEWRRVVPQHSAIIL